MSKKEEGMKRADYVELFGVLEWVGVAAQGVEVVTGPTDVLTLEFDGAPGFRHQGSTLKAGGRCHPFVKGLQVRNRRNISIVCPDELKIIGKRLQEKLEVEQEIKIEPEHLGANMMISGIKYLTFLPPATELFFFPEDAMPEESEFKGEAVCMLRIEDLNNPCAAPGKVIQSKLDIPNIRRNFTEAAQGLRGVVASIDLPGGVQAGMKVVAAIPRKYAAFYNLRSTEKWANDNPEQV